VLCWAGWSAAASPPVLNGVDRLQGPRERPGPHCCSYPGARRMTIDDWEQMLAVNLMTTVCPTQAAI
jgi:hypothetical protein